MPDTIQPLTIRMFGPLQVLVRGEPLPKVRSRNVHWILALLALRHGRTVNRTWLAGTLWPESDESRALKYLRDDLMRLRDALGEEATRIQSPTRDTLCIRLEGADVDVVRFDRAMQTGGDEALHEAVSLFAGPLLEGWYEEWAVSERESRARKCLEALERLADSAVGRADQTSAISYLRRAESLDPMRESISRRLMSSLDNSGDPTAAIEVYRNLRERLHAELATSPDRETTELFQSIRHQARQIAAAPAVRNQPPITDHPHTPTRTQPITHAIRPPHLISQLIGREEELIGIREALGRSRLVTLVGSGGVGKTSLAAVVSTLAGEECVGGAVWVELAALTDPTLVVPAIAAALGVQEGEGAGEDGGEEGRRDAFLQRVITRLAAAPVLLTVDNCEHLIGSAADTAQTLLRAAPDLRVLATSRERLGIAGEIVWRVSSLGLPDESSVCSSEEMERVLQSPSVRLFVDRAQAASASWSLSAPEDVIAVCAICRRLDGIPLAIELAAARTPTLAPRQIAERLDDRFRLLTTGARGALPRQKTLRALIDWSYDQLPPEESALLVRLSVFVGGWTLDAAEAIQNPKPKAQNPDVLDLLGSLVDKSLVLAEEHSAGARYRMLETVRDYSRDKLRGQGEEADARNAHLAWCAALSESVEDGLRGADPQAALAAVDAEIGNIRAALACALTDQVPHGASLKVAAALWPYWEMRGLHTEGREHLRSALSRSPSDCPERAEALLGAASLAFVQADLGPTSDLARQSLVLFRERNDPKGTAAALILCGHAALERNSFDEASRLLEEALAASWECRWDRGRALALTNLGLASMRGGRGEQALAQLDEALTLAEATGHAQTLALTLHNRGFLARELGDLDRAASLLERSLGIWRRLGHGHKASLTLRNLGQIARHQGDMEGALVYFGEAVAACRVQGNRFHLAFLLLERGGVHYVLEDHEQACCAYAESLELFSQIGSDWGLNASRMGLGSSLFHLGEYGRAKELHELALAHYRSIDSLDGLAWSLERLAIVESVDGDAQKAARLMGSASVLREKFGKPRDHWDEMDWEAAVRRVRAELTEEEFGREFGRGEGNEKCKVKNEK